MNTPIKRAGVLVAAVGFALLAFGLVALLDRHDLEDAWRCVLGDGRRHWEGCTPTRWGAWLALLGLLASVAFDYTLGPLWRWIRYGRTKPAPINGAPSKPVPLHELRDFGAQPITPDEWAEARRARDEQEDRQARKHGWIPPDER